MIISTTENFNRTETEMIIVNYSKVTYPKKSLQHTPKRISNEVGKIPLKIFITVPNIYLQKCINKLVENIVKEE